MTQPEDVRPMSPSSAAFDESNCERHFGGVEGLLPLWIAEPYLPIATEVVGALKERAELAWCGYETRPSETLEAFWAWMKGRHEWDGDGLHATFSPSVGTSMGVLIDQLTEPGDGVILQPPVFTGFKPLVTAADRAVVRNALVDDGDHYRMDLADLEAKVSDPATRMLLLCNPHNPVGRLWRADELAEVARVCARHDVFVVSDEIHADIVLHDGRFTPFGPIATEAGTAWAALHGPIKSFGLAGVCESLLVAGDPEIVRTFRSVHSRLHLARVNIFGTAAFRTAYEKGGTWLDATLRLVERNLEALRDGLPEGIGLRELEGTYLAWLDFRGLGMDVPELTEWLAAEARLGLSPGHWFGREGAGFARMTVAAPESTVRSAIDRLTRAVAAR